MHLDKPSEDVKPTNDSEWANSVRKFIYDHFVNHSRAPLVEELVANFQISKQKILSILHNLHEKHLLVMENNSPRILIAHPFFNMPTSWTVITGNNKQYFAGCAWNAIAMHATLKQPITIKSFCVHCSEKIELTVKDHKISKKQPDTLLIHISKPLNQWWDDVIDTCTNHINYFSSKKHLEEWQAEHPDYPGYTISEEQVLEFCKFLYLNKLDEDYERPSPEELKSFLQSVGLTGDFWQI